MDKINSSSFKATKNKISYNQHLLIHRLFCEKFNERAPGQATFNS